MKKVLFIPIIAGAGVIIFSSVYAFQGGEQGRGRGGEDSLGGEGRGYMHARFSSDEHGRGVFNEDLRDALDNGDYEAFLAVAPAPLLERIDTEDKFVLFVELHEAMDMEDMERVEELRTELGLAQGMKGPGYGMRGQGQGRHEQHGRHGAHEKGNPEDHIADIPVSDLSNAEAESLMKQYEEEMMANELYTRFYEKYGVPVFDNIANSEAHHMEAVNVLLERYGLGHPTNYDHIQTLYDELKAKGDVSLQDALEVGLMIEKVDIDDIKTAIKNTDNDDIKTIFVFIGGASYNHMRGFAKNIDMQGFKTDIDFSHYLDDDEVNTRGPLMWKLAEDLEIEGVDLPVGATSVAVKEHMEAHRGENMKGEREQQGERKRGTRDNMKGMRGMRGEGKEGNLKKGTRDMRGSKMRYKQLIRNQFGEKLKKFDDVKRTKVQTRIGAYREKLMLNTTLSSEKKDQLTLVLDALEEVLSE